MSNTIKILRNLCFVILLCFSNTLTAMAYDEKVCDEAREKDDYSNPLSWRQVHEAGMSTPKGADDTLLLKPDGFTLEYAGCSYYSLSYCLIRHGDMNPKKETVIDVLNKIRDKGLNTGQGQNDGAGFGAVPWSKLSQVYDIKDATRQGGGTTYGGILDPATMAQTCKQALDDGHYVIICFINNEQTGRSKGQERYTNGHYIAIDKVEGSEIYINDSYSTCRTWNEGYGKDGAQVIDYVLIDFKDGKGPNDGISLWDKYGSNSTTEASEEDSENGQEEDKISTIVPEWEIEGMPEKSKSMQETKETPPLTTSTDLSTAEKVKYQDISESVGITNQINRMNLIRKLVSMAGLVMCIYAMFVLVGYLFDINNPFFDLSMVTMLTFGLLTVEYKSEQTKSLWNQGEGSRQVMTLIIGFMVVGMLICTGALSIYAMQKLNNLNQLYDNIWWWLTT